MHPVEQIPPHGPVHVPERQAELADDVGVQAFAVQDLGDVVDRRGVGAGDAAVDVHVAHQRDLRLEGCRDLPIAAQHQRVGLDADVAQRRHRMLGGLGLELTRRRQVGHEGDVQEEDVAATDVVADLARRFEEGLGLDVADGAPDLGDDHIGNVAVLVGAGHRHDPVLDLVGDVRDHLDGVAEVLAAPLLGDDRGVDLAGGDVGGGVEIAVEEAFVVAHVQVGLGAVLGDEDLAVLEGVHGARIDIQIGVELLHGHAHSARGEKSAQARCRQPLAQRGGDAPADEDVLGGGTRVA